jgi:hypothetical protein
MDKASDRAQLVKMARALERALIRRRKLVKQLTTLDGEIREFRKFIRDLTEPDPADVYKSGDDNA